MIPVSLPRWTPSPPVLTFVRIIILSLPLFQSTTRAHTEDFIACSSGHRTTITHHHQKTKFIDELAALNNPLNPLHPLHTLPPRGGGDADDDDNTIVPPPPSPTKTDIVIGIDGGTESIRACCFDARSGRIIGKSHAVPYTTSHPAAGWAEQSPEEWYRNLCEAVKGAIGTLPSNSKEDNDDNNNNTNDDDDMDVDVEYDVKYDVKALCCDTTCCSVVALSSEYTPLRPCLLWMDARSAGQAAKIMDVAKSHAAKESSSSSQSILDAFPELRVNSHGEGPISAEWLLPKAMWIKEREPSVWEDATVICEYQDYINYKLTGKMVASSCNAAVRWHHDGVDVLNKDEDGGRPMKLYEALGMDDLAEKLPKETLAMGEVVGGLTEEAAGHLGLPVGTKVVQGGPDAFVGMIGLGTIRPHQICLITGSSHLHCLLTPSATSAPGTWGAYRGAPLPHLNFAEGGQSSTGSLVRWVRDMISGDGEKISYRVLDEEASRVAPGCDGLVALETWQGSRTPHTDPLARGAFVGLTLSHTRAHIFRAILESVCYGTRSCFDALEAAAATAAAEQQQSSRTDGAASSKKSNEVVIAGGATRSDLWLQLHADITGRTFLLNENTDGPLLGCAILASVGAGIYDSVDDAVENMVRRERRIEPRAEARKVYDRLYEEVYLKVRPGVKSVVHAVAELRGGASSSVGEERAVWGGGLNKLGLQHGNGIRCGKWGTKCLGTIRGGNMDESLQQSDATPRNAPIIISPSLLASDWSDMKGEVQKCLDAGVPWLHIDVFDGVFLDSPNALTFGPQMVDNLSKRFANLHPELTLDVHLCVDRPERYAIPMAEAGATRIIFQWEAMGGENNHGDDGNTLSSAISFARTITSLGMKCGVSINPETPVKSIFPLLDSGLVDLVDVLAVEPGFGGQEFNKVAIPKIVMLRQYRDEKLRTSNGAEYVDVKILVDGGIHRGTSSLVRSAGADILVAGTALFRHPLGFEEAVNELL